MSSFSIAVAAGWLDDWTRVTALGNNPSVDTSAEEDVWPVGGLYPLPSSAVAMEIVSTSANDAAAGTGARTVRVDGLTADYVMLSQTVTLNGTTPVALPTPLFRINFMVVMTAGSLERNDGVIDVRRVSGGTVQSRIPKIPNLGASVSQQAVYTVPAGHTLFVESLVFSINRSTGVGRFATAATMFRASNGVQRLPLVVSFADSMPYRHSGDSGPPIRVPEKTDFILRVLSVSTNATDITAGFLGGLKSNP